MSRLVGWNYTPNEKVIVVATETVVPWFGDGGDTVVSPVAVGSVGTVNGEIDADGEVMVVWPELGTRCYIHFALIQPIPPDLPTKPMAPEDIEEFLTKEDDPWN